LIPLSHLDSMVPILIREGLPLWTDKNRAKYSRDHLRYPSDLTDDEWAHVERLIPPARRGGGKRRTDMRAVMNGVMYILSTGCQWRSIVSVVILVRLAAVCPVLRIQLIANLRNPKRACCRRRWPGGEPPASSLSQLQRIILRILFGHSRRA
jgi:hypothetical protein